MNFAHVHACLQETFGTFQLPSDFSETLPSKSLGWTSRNSEGIQSVTCNRSKGVGIDGDGASSKVPKQSSHTNIYIYYIPIILISFLVVLESFGWTSPKNMIRIFSPGLWKRAAVASNQHLRRRRSPRRSSNQPWPLVATRVGMGILCPLGLLIFSFLTILYYTDKNLQLLQGMKFQFA